MSLTPFHTSTSPRRFLPTPRNSNNLSGLATGALRRRLLSRHGAYVENSPPLTVFVLFVLPIANSPRDDAKAVATVMTGED